MADNSGGLGKVLSDAITEISGRMQRARATQVAQSAADLNQRQPPLRYTKSGKAYYDTAPVFLRRLMGSPLGLTGANAIGPNRERTVISGWGDAQSTAYGRGDPAWAVNTGIDFKAPVNEPVLAVGDGTVSFVGFLTRKGTGYEFNNPTSNSAGQITDAQGTVLAQPEDLAFGGIIVHLTMSGDFAGYRAEYYHLYDAVVSVGQKVLEGDIIGFVGNTGCRPIEPHLHFQVAYVASKTPTLVNPTAIVPNYRQGKPNSTNSGGPRSLVIPVDAPAGVQAAAAAGASTVNGLDRATTMSNQSLSDIRAQWAAHGGFIGRFFGASEVAMHSSVAAFQSAPIEVASPMTFDFTAGTWNDGKAV